MKLLLAIFQIISSIHVDQHNGIIFIKDKPVRLYKKYEKVYLDTIIRSPRELLNYGELNFPDEKICYSSRRNRQTETITCGEILDKFDKKVMDFAKVDIVNHEKENRIQKRFVVTAAVFGISIAITSLLGYFFGKANTETQTDILAKEMEEERARMSNMTRAAEISKETIHEMALEMRENGHLATAESPSELIKYYIQESTSFSITMENNRNGPDFMKRLIETQFNQITSDHWQLINSQLPYTRMDLHRNTLTAKCLSIQYSINDATKEFCRTYTEDFHTYSNSAKMKYHGLSITKNENGKIKEIIMSASLNIPILEEPIYDSYQIINMGTFTENEKIKLDVPKNIIINGLEIDGYNGFKCENIGNTFSICPANIMVPDDECTGNIFHEAKTNQCDIIIQKTRKTCFIYENDEFLAVSMSKSVQQSKTRKISKFELIPKTNNLEFKCPNSRRKIHIAAIHDSKIELSINILNSTIATQNDRMSQIETKLNQMDTIIKDTNKTVDYHSNALNETITKFKKDVEDTAESIPEAIEKQLKELFMLALPYLVTFAVTMILSLLACCIIPCVYRKMKKLMFTSHVSYHPDNSPNPQSAI